MASHRQGVIVIVRSFWKAWRIPACLKKLFQLSKENKGEYERK